MKHQNCLGTNRPCWVWIIWVRTVLGYETSGKLLTLKNTASALRTHRNMTYWTRYNLQRKACSGHCVTGPDCRTAWGAFEHDWSSSVLTWILSGMGILRSSHGVKCFIVPERTRLVRNNLAVSHGNTNCPQASINVSYESLKNIAQTKENKVIFFLFQDVRFNLEKMTYQKHFYFDENKLQFQGHFE